jgi:hypothetical protein
MCEMPQTKREIMALKTQGHRTMDSRDRFNCVEIFHRPPKPMIGTMINPAMLCRGFAGDGSDPATRLPRDDG